MSKKSISNDTSKATNTYINVKLVNSRCVSWLNVVKEETGRTFQEELTNAYIEYISRHYAIKHKGESQ